MTMITISLAILIAVIILVEWAIHYYGKPGE